MEAAAPNHVEISANEWKKNFWIGPSRIAGCGTFAARAFSAGAIIGPAWIAGRRTELGCYGNHSVAPTAYMKFSEGCVLLVALLNMNSGEELTTNYRDTLATIRERGVNHYG